jgi:hypothetical protein
MEEAVRNPLDEALLKSEVTRRLFEQTNQAEAWMDDYFALVAEGWSWRQAVYMLWASQPQPRHPETQAALAREVLGLTSDRQIREWKAKNPAMEGRIAKLTASALGKYRAAIIQALGESAATPSYRNHRDRRLALEMLGDYTPKQALDLGLPTTPEEIEDADTETLRELAQSPVAQEDEA